MNPSVTRDSVYFQKNKEARPLLILVLLLMLVLQIIKLPHLNRGENTKKSVKNTTPFQDFDLLLFADEM